MVKLGQKFGVDKVKMNDIVQSSRHIVDPAKKSFDVLQKVSFAGKQFPLFMGGNWPESVKNARPASIVAIKSSGPSDWTYNPSETEWRIRDPEKIKGIEKL